MAHQFPLKAAFGGLYVAGSLVLALVQPAVAQGRPATPPAVFFETAQAGPARAADPSVVRGRTVDVDLDLLGGETLHLNLFEDASFVARRDRQSGGLGGTYTWSGHIAGVAHSQVVLVVRDGVLSGTVKWPGNLYTLRNAGGGLLVVEQIDQARLPPHAQPIPVRRPGLEKSGGLRDLEGAGEASAAAAEGAAAAGAAQTVDVMVVYTERSRARYNPDDALASGIEGMILTAIAEANLAYQNSQVGITLNLVEMAKVDYDETGGGMLQSLEDLTDQTDGFMDEVHALRDGNFADLVSLVTEDNDYCGIAWLMQELDLAFEESAFSVTFSSCLANYTQTHEFGHSMGSMHNRENSAIPGVYPYSYGYRSRDDGWHSIMSYACAGCARIGHFSSPNVLYGVTPTGIDHETDPDNSADNARSLNNTAFTVAQFREVAPTDPPAMAPANLAATAVSYGQIDLSWDYSGDDHWSFEIERSIDQAGWAVVGFAIGNFTSYSDTTAYPSTTYFYRIRAVNPVGASAWSNTASATTGEAPPYTDDMAVAEERVFGSVGGDYTATTGNDGVRQTIAERVTGGKPSKRTSKADHKWIFNVTRGAAVTFFLKASAAASSDGDSFDFIESSNDIWYNYMLTVDGTTDANSYQSFALPPTVNGTHYVRVIDSDRTPGNLALDSVTVDHMYIRSEAAFGDPPAAPSGLTATAVSAGQIDLSWTDNSMGEYGFKVYHAHQGLAMHLVASTGADATAFSDTAEMIPSTTYDYEVVAFNAVGESAPSNGAGATTLAGIFLTVEPYKLKGYHKAHLRWSGATSDNVNILRNGATIATTVDDGLYTDATGQKGSGSYVYEVCEALESNVSGTCSSAVEVVF